MRGKAARRAAEARTPARMEPPGRRRQQGKSWPEEYTFPKGLEYYSSEGIPTDIMKRKPRKKVKPDFKAYLDALPPEDKKLIESFFIDISRHIALDSKHTRQIHDDFEKALRYYASTNTCLRTALERLDPSRLGGFYVRPPVLWYPLDYAAKIYPLSMKRNQMSVFRLSVYMKDMVIPELLQIALTFTIKRFPSFATTLKKGFFWHYLDAAKRHYTIEPETSIPCRPLNVSASGSQSFRVLYYGPRISVEFFHVLTDGTGGMVFLKNLAAEYLRLLGAVIYRTDGIVDINEAPLPEETSNDFPKAEPAGKKSGFVDKPALQMSGRLSSVRPCQIIQFELDSAALREISKRKGGSVTAYILALMFIAHKYSTDEPEGPINIQVPVNMRKFYKSATLRNFSMYCGIRLKLSDISDPEENIPSIVKQLNEKASRESMNEMMNATVGLVRALRYVPLFIKQPAASLVYGFLGDRLFSNTFSNIGIVNLPTEMEDNIDRFEAVLGPSSINRASCAMISFGGKTVLSVTKRTADPTFEEKLCALFRAEGLEPKTRGSALYGN